MKLGRILSVHGIPERSRVGFNNGDIVVINGRNSDSTTTISTLSTEFGSNQTMRRTIINNDAVSIFIIEDRYDFRHSTIESIGGIGQITSNGQEVMLSDFVRRFSLNSRSELSILEHTRFLKSYNPSVNPKTDETDDKIISKNLKIIFPNGAAISTNNLLEMFKYIPIRLYGNYGWYDPENKRFVIIEKLVIQNKKKPWITKINKKIVFYKLSDLNINESDVVKFFHGDLLKKCQFKVKNYIDSSKIFKFTNEKKEAVGKIYEALEIVFSYQSKNVTNPINTIILKLPNGNRRFILSDVEIQYPNIKGYCETKDRVIKAGIKVKVIDDKHTIFKKNDIVIPSLIKKIGLKSYAVFEVNNTVKLYNINKFKTI